MEESFVDIEAANNIKVDGVLAEQQSLVRIQVTFCLDDPAAHQEAQSSKELCG